MEWGWRLAVVLLLARLLAVQEQQLRELKDIGSSANGVVRETMGVKYLIQEEKSELIKTRDAIYDLKSK